MLRQQGAHDDSRPNRSLADFVAPARDRPPGPHRRLRRRDPRRRRAGGVVRARGRRLQRDHGQGARGPARRGVRGVAARADAAARGTRRTSSSAPRSSSPSASAGSGRRSATPPAPTTREKGTLFALLGADEAGLTLTETYAAVPGSGVSGLYLGHPSARYFSIGRIGRDQVEDYAERKGEELVGRRALAPPEPRLRPALARRTDLPRGADRRDAASPSARHGAAADAAVPKRRRYSGLCARPRVLVALAVTPVAGRGRRAAEGADEQGQRDGAVDRAQARRPVDRVLRSPATGRQPARRRALRRARRVRPHDHRRRAVARLRAEPAGPLRHRRLDRARLPHAARGGLSWKRGSSAQTTTCFADIVRLSAPRGQKRLDRLGEAAAFPKVAPMTVGVPRGRDADARRATGGSAPTSTRRPPARSGPVRSRVHVARPPGRAGRRARPRARSSRCGWPRRPARRARTPDRRLGPPGLPRTGERSPVRGADIWDDGRSNRPRGRLRGCGRRLGAARPSRCSSVGSAPAGAPPVRLAIVTADGECRRSASSASELADLATRTRRGTILLSGRCGATSRSCARRASRRSAGSASATTGRSTASSRRSPEASDDVGEGRDAARPARAAAGPATAAAPRPPERRRPVLRRSAARPLRGRSPSTTSLR